MPVSPQLCPLPLLPDQPLNLLFLMHESIWHTTSVEIRKRRINTLKYFLAICYTSVMAKIVSKMPKRKMRTILKIQYFYSFLSTYMDGHLEHENISTSRKRNDFTISFFIPLAIISECLLVYNLFYLHTCKELMCRKGIEIDFSIHHITASPGMWKDCRWKRKPM